MKILQCGCSKIFENPGGSCGAGENCINQRQYMKLHIQSDQTRKEVLLEDLQDFKIALDNAEMDKLKNDAWIEKLKNNIGQVELELSEIGRPKGWDRDGYDESLVGSNLK